jgi:hypothetical protein
MHRSYRFITLVKAYRPLALMLCIALVPACADKPEKEPAKQTEEKDKPRLVGRVASIPADREFVLIQAYGTWSVATGSILTTQGPEGRAANLRATGEKLGQFAAADIQSGTLEIGDGVYQSPNRLEAPGTSPPSEIPPTGDEDLQAETG